MQVIGWPNLDPYTAIHHPFLLLPFPHNTHLEDSHSIISSHDKSDRDWQWLWPKKSKTQTRTSLFLAVLTDNGAKQCFLSFFLSFSPWLHSSSFLVVVFIYLFFIIISFCGLYWLFLCRITFLKREGGKNLLERKISSFCGLFRW